MYWLVGGWGGVGGGICTNLTAPSWLHAQSQAGHWSNPASGVETAPATAPASPSVQLLTLHTQRLTELC